MLAFSLFVICTEIHIVEKQLTEACEAAGVDQQQKLGLVVEKHEYCFVCPEGWIDRLDSDAFSSVNSASKSIISRQPKDI